MKNEIYIINKITGEKVLSPLPFMVAENDLPGYVTWNKATNSSETMGEGWRLPTENEIEMMYEFKIILGLDKRGYWTNSESAAMAYSKGFKWYLPSRFVVKFSTCGARFVKD